MASRVVHNEREIGLTCFTIEIPISNFKQDVLLLLRDVIDSQHRRGKERNFFFSGCEAGRWRERGRGREVRKNGSCNQEAEHKNLYRHACEMAIKDGDNGLDDSSHEFQDVDTIGVFGSRRLF